MFEQQLTSPCRTPEPRELQRWSPFIHGAGERKKMLCREGLRSFARIGFSPQSSSGMTFYVDGGLVDKGPLPSRKKDQVGVGFVYAQMGQDMVVQANAPERREPIQQRPRHRPASGREFLTPIRAELPLYVPRGACVC
jgi:Carbohydrate-selective porin, OprB family